MGCLTGSHQLSAWFVKLALEHLVSPLTAIINNSILKLYFPCTLETSTYKPLPKSCHPSHGRPPASSVHLSSAIKGLWKLAASQIANFYTKKSLLRDTILSFYSSLGHTRQHAECCERREVTPVVLKNSLKACLLQNSDNQAVPARFFKECSWMAG